MTFDEFMNKYDEYENRSKQYKIYSDDNFIYTSWITGGVDGGNCWSDGGHYSITGEKPQDIEGYVFDFIQELNPNLTYKYVKELKTFFDVSEWSEGGYYGNYTVGLKKKISLQKMYEYLYETN